MHETKKKNATVKSKPVIETQTQAPSQTLAQSQATDALALWGTEVNTSPVNLSVIRLDGNERLVIPFTTTIARVKVHYFEVPSMREYIHCSGQDCLLCRVGRQVDERDLLPVYDVMSKTIGVLPISPNIRPNALRPQLAPVLQRLKEEKRFLVSIRKLDAVRFCVTTYDLPPNAEDGADVILAFKNEFEAGRIDLSNVYTKLAKEDLMMVPEIITLMTMKGIN